MSPSLLSRRLGQLQRAGLLERHSDDDAPTYHLTDAGEELGPIVEGLGAWGQRWMHEIADDELDPTLLMVDASEEHAADAIPRGTGSGHASGSGATVEGEVRAKLSAQFGGLRGSLETSLPVVVFTVVWLATHALRPAVVVAVAAAVVAYGVRRAQGSEARYVRQGLLGILIAAAFAGSTGQAETVFLPGIIQNGIGALVLGLSLVARAPVAGFVIGEVLGNRTGWREDPGILRLSDRLTLVMLAPMLLRLAVQVPLYLAGEVGWLGVSRVVLGWPLHAATLALLGLILLRSRTPLRRAEEDAHEGP